MGDRVAGKVALVTGAASGIGRSCSLTLAREGAAVVLTDIDDAAGSTVARHINEQGGRAEYLHHDVTNEDHWISVVSQVVDRHDQLTIVVNNAGIGIGGSIVDMDLDDFRRQMAINVDGVFLGMKHSIPAMRGSGGGSIINMSSVAGLKGSPRLAGYNATKGAVRLMTKGVALECAHSKWAVRVNSVHPGIIETPIWDTVGAAAIAGQGSIDAAQMASAIVPGGRLGSPDDVATAVLFLASDESQYITGTELVVDAGMSA